MKLKMLPNWCKKVGVSLYIIGAIPSAYTGYMDGINEYNNPSIINDNSHLWFSDIILYLGLIIYFLSKEKIEDDYINKLRLESYQVTIIIGIILSFITFIIFKNIEIQNSLFLESFLMIYLLIFWYKKRQF